MCIAQPDHLKSTQIFIKRNFGSSFWSFRRLISIEKRHLGSQCSRIFIPKFDLNAINQQNERKMRDWTLRTSYNDSRYYSIGKTLPPKTKLPFIAFHDQSVFLKRQNYNVDDSLKLCQEKMRSQI